MKELRELAGFVSGFKLEDAGTEVKETAEYCVLDTVALALGAARNGMFEEIRNIYRQYDGEGDVALWGTKEKVNLRTAVFLNAMMSHILELDDVHVRSKTHIGAVVIPTAWSVAEALGKSGKEFLEAVICGYEVMARIGMGFGVSSHRNKGWHVTCTAGVFGAAAVCGKLFGFDENQMMAAFGLAGTQSCGTWAFLSDGATNKILHPGRAAANGLESCFLVLGGMKGSAGILNAEDGGIFPMMSDEHDYSLVSKDLGIVYEIMRMDRKPYPCCRSTHCAIDAARRLKKTYGFCIDRIWSVEVGTYKVGVKQCGLAKSSLCPQLPTDAKFSTPYTVACALLNGTVSLADFYEDAIHGEEIQKLLKRVKVEEDPQFTDKYPEHWGCRMKICMTDGSEYVTTVEDASGSEHVPLSKEQIVEKAKSCCKDYDPAWVEGMIGFVFSAVDQPIMMKLGK